MSKVSIPRAACLAIALAAMIGGAIQASPGPRPFRGHAAAVITNAVPESDGMHLTVVATGQATHLGNFTRTENLVLLNGVVTGTIIFTDVHGDQLEAEVAGAFTSATTAVGTYTFTGGTGRFTDATGSAAFVAETADGIHFDIAFDGTVSF